MSKKIKKIEMALFVASSIAKWEEILDHVKNKHEIDYWREYWHPCGY
jgi:hypothetical protein